MLFFFFNDTATTEIYTLSLHDALPILVQPLKSEQTMDLDATFARSVGYWWGSFGQRYGFFTRANSIYRFDYYEMNQRSEEHTSELQSRQYLVCRLLLEKKKTDNPLFRF